MFFFSHLNFIRWEDYNKLSLGKSSNDHTNERREKQKMEKFKLTILLIFKFKFYLCLLSTVFDFRNIFARIIVKMFPNMVRSLFIGWGISGAYSEV